VKCADKFIIAAEYEIEMHSNRPSFFKSGVSLNVWLKKTSTFV